MEEDLLVKKRNIGIILETAHRRNTDENNDDDETEKLNMIADHVNDTVVQLHEFDKLTYTFGDDDCSDSDCEPDDDFPTNVFIEQNKQLLKQYVEGENNATQTFLEENLQILCDESIEYIQAWSINLQMRDKSDDMDIATEKLIIVKSIFILIKTLKLDPIQCIRKFFERMKRDEEYKTEIKNALDRFQVYVIERAEQKNKELDEQEKKRQKRLGPGGLDRIEVAKSLPKELKKCFQSRNLEQLQDVLSTMSREDADHYIDLCAKSGLLVPKEKDAEGDGKEQMKNNKEKVKEDVGKSQAEQ